MIRMDSDKVENEKLPNMASFCLNVPLYKTFKFKDNKTDNEAIENLRWYREHFDCYCLDCKKASVFHADNKGRSSTSYASMEQCVFSHKFSCSRNNEHKIFLSFRLTPGTITKIGQYPSLADLASVEIQEYRSVLGATRSAEFNSAVGLASQGIGIGAFVYLRRIFESLVEEAHKLEMNKDGWDEEMYKKKKYMAQKIEILEGSLPKFLVDNSSIYKILSKGIHQLKENECLSAFPKIKLGIELMLDEKLEKLKREEKIVNATKEISNLAQGLK